MFYYLCVKGVDNYVYITNKIRINCEQVMYKIITAIVFY